MNKFLDWINSLAIKLNDFNDMLLNTSVVTLEKPPLVQGGSETTDSETNMKQCVCIFSTTILEALTPTNLVTNPTTVPEITTEIHPESNTYTSCAMEIFWHSLLGVFNSDLFLSTIFLSFLTYLVIHLILSRYSEEVLEVADLEELKLTNRNHSNESISSEDIMEGSIHQVINSIEDSMELTKQKLSMNYLLQPQSSNLSRCIEYFDDWLPDEYTISDISSVRRIQNQLFSNIDSSDSDEDEKPDQLYEIAGISIEEARNSIDQPNSPQLIDLPEESNNSDLVDLPEISNTSSSNSSLTGLINLVNEQSICNKGKRPSIKHVGSINSSEIIIEDPEKENEFIPQSDIPQIDYKIFPRRPKSETHTLSLGDALSTDLSNTLGRFQR